MTADSRYAYFGVHLFDVMLLPFCALFAADTFRSLYIPLPNLPFPLFLDSRTAQQLDTS